MQKAVTLIHRNGSYIFLLITNSLKANQACFILYKEIFGSRDIFSCKHAAENEEFENLYFPYDSTLLLKIFIITGRLKNAKN